MLKTACIEAPPLPAFSSAAFFCFFRSERARHHARKVPSASFPISSFLLILARG
ncbi:hypothetical protein GCWU000341_01835 [Oribacterium sp. oral taxon 078 str. F0262]|nr:hypothetical protein GCWU000341_01835 [Oribacterium sp. oral taxon 078 str. F0262]